MAYTSELDYETKGALINGFAGLHQFNKNSLLRGCSSGNCTFPKRNGISHSTIGLCSKCVDTTQYLRESRDQMGILLPNNLIMSISEVLSMSAASIGSERDDLSWVPGMDESVRRASLVNWTMIVSTKKTCAQSSTGLTGSPNWGYYTPPPCEPGPHNFSSGWDRSNFVSAACTLYPCTKYFNAEVIKGDLKETLVSEVSSSEMVSETRYRSQGSIVTGPLKWEEDTYYTANASCDIDGVNQDLKSTPIIRAERGGRVYVKINGRKVELPKGCTHSHTGTWFLGFNAFLQATMNGFCSEAQSLIADVSCGLKSEQRRPQNSTMDKSKVQDRTNAWWLASIYNHGNSTFNLTSKHAQILADTFTDRIRQIVAKQAVYGTEEETAICTRFRWQWLLLPASLLLITALVLMKIIIGEKFDEEDRPIWKNSILPTIYAGSKLKPGMKMVMSNKVESMEEAARGVKVRLVLCPDNERWELLIDDERFDQSYSSALNIRHQ
jgi:hypothetical protein